MLFDSVFSDSFFAERLSKHAREILQGATQLAAQLERPEVDAEHLLYALATAT